MRFTCAIEMDNAAFEDDAPAELARILGVVSEKVQSGDDSLILRDINGNAVGFFSIVQGK